MDPAEMERRFKAAIADLGLSADQAQALGAQLVQTEKAAAAQGVAYKSAADAPDTIVINSVTYKAAPPPPELPPAAPVAEAKADGDAVEDVVEAVDDGGEMGGPYVGDLTPDEFFAKLADLLAPVIKMQDMVKSIGDMTGELKSMYGGTATKEAGLAAELVTLKEQQRQLAEKIATIEGQQPAVVLPADVAEALKSAGPQTPPDPKAPQVPNDPNRPWAGWAAQTFPELYTPQS